LQKLAVCLGFLGRFSRFSRDKKILKNRVKTPTKTPT